MSKGEFLGTIAMVFVVAFVGFALFDRLKLEKVKAIGNLMIFGPAVVGIIVGVILSAAVQASVEMFLVPFLIGMLLMYFIMAIALFIPPVGNICFDRKN